MRVQGGLREKEGGFWVQDTRIHADRTALGSGYDRHGERYLFSKLITLQKTFERFGQRKRKRGREKRERDGERERDI